MSLMFKNQLFFFLLMLMSYGLYGQDEQHILLSEPTRPTYISFEIGFERKNEKDIKSIGTRITFEHFHRDRFATGIELTPKYYFGSRSNLQNNTMALGLGYIVKYHYIQNSRFSLFFDCGFGAIYSVDRFPKNGTHFNAQYYGGFGANFNLSPIKALQFGFRFFHSSNGRGLTFDNPAYDSINIYTGINF